MSSYFQQRLDIAEIASKLHKAGVGHATKPFNKNLLVFEGFTEDLEMARRVIDMLYKCRLVYRNSKAGKKDKQYQYSFNYTKTKLTDPVAISTYLHKATKQYGKEKKTKPKTKVTVKSKAVVVSDKTIPHHTVTVVRTNIEHVRISVPVNYTHDQCKVEAMEVAQWELYSSSTNTIINTSMAVHS